MIPYGRQNVTEEDIEAVVDVLRSDFLTQGPVVPQFEAAIEKYCGVRFAVAVNSATSALHIACMALDLKEGDWLWTSPITFVASANCGRYCGAQVDFVDIDPLTWNLDVKALSAKLELAKLKGRLPKVLVAVHFTGLPCDMREIKRLSTEYGFKVIEDASHAIGAKYLKKPVGSCEFSDITVFSFHPVKIITTGEGGAATTNDPRLARKMELLRSHGITRDYSQMTHPTKDAWYYEQHILGYNYRMTDIQAALGLSQIQRLDDNIAARRVIAEKYSGELSHSLLKLPVHTAGGFSSWHIYVIRLREPLDRQAIFEYLRSVNIGVNVHYIPVHIQPYYEERGGEIGYKKETFPVALDYYKEAISLPIFPTLKSCDVDHIVNEIKMCCENKIFHLKN